MPSDVWPRRSGCDPPSTSFGGKSISLRTFANEKLPDLPGAPVNHLLAPRDPVVAAGDGATAAVASIAAVAWAVVVGCLRGLTLSLTLMVGWLRGRMEGLLVV